MICGLSDARPGARPGDTINGPRETSRSGPRSHLSGHPLEHHYRAPFLSVPRVFSNGGGNRQGIPFGLEETHLLTAGPHLVPGDLDIMDDLVAIYPVCARVSDHCAEQLSFFLVSWHCTGKLRAV